MLDMRKCELHLLYSIKNSSPASKYIRVHTYKYIYIVVVLRMITGALHANKTRQKY